MNRSKKVRVVLSLCLVAVILVGAAWAYLSVVTNEKTNMFTFQTNITAVLEEPDWDGEDVPDADGDGTPDAAENMVPGGEVLKNPRIVNTSAIDEYVAIRLTFQTSAGVTLTQPQMDKLFTLIQLQYGAAAPFTNGYNTVKWSLVNSTDAGKPVQIWYYTDLVPHTTGNTTQAIFNNVKILSTVNSKDIAWLTTTDSVDFDGIPANLDEMDGIGGFNIKIEGSAVQASTFTSASDATSALVGLFPTTP